MTLDVRSKIPLMNVDETNRNQTARAPAMNHRQANSSPQAQINIYPQMFSINKNLRFFMFNGCQTYIFKQKMET